MVLAGCGGEGGAPSTSAPPSLSVTTTTTGSAPPAPTTTAVVPVTPGRPETARRVSDILVSMHQHAFNPSAPAAKGGAAPGGLFINWVGTWDGDPITAATQTNLRTDGQSDDEASVATRHDPVTDLMYLDTLVRYQAAFPADHSFDGDVSRIEAIVRAEFAGYTYYRCWLYTEFRDLSAAAPGRGWETYASNYATAIFQRSYDKALGTVVDAAHGSYRVDWAVECGSAMIDEGTRHANAAMVAAGRSTLSRVLAGAQDPTTHLFPTQMTAAAGGDTVKQAQVKVGSQAQLVDALLSAYDVTHDAAYLQAATATLNSLYTIGLWDPANGGFFFSIDSGGGNLNRDYKESRQGWILQALVHMDRVAPGWHDRAVQMLGVVRDRLWQQPLQGYVYRVAPSFAVFSTRNGVGKTLVVEDFVTTEAMGLCGQSLETAYAAGL